MAIAWVVALGLQLPFNSIVAVDCICVNVETAWPLFKYARGQRIFILIRKVDAIVAEKICRLEPSTSVYDLLTSFSCELVQRIIAQCSTDVSPFTEEAAVVMPRSVMSPSQLTFVIHRTCYFFLVPGDFFFCKSVFVNELVLKPTTFDTSTLLDHQSNQNH